MSKRYVLVWIPATDEMREMLERTVIGDGGFQRLARDLQACARKDAAGKIEGLSLDLSLLAKVVAYTSQYGDGGFQGRMKPIVSQVRALARIVAPLDDGGAQKKMFAGDDGSGR